MQCECELNLFDAGQGLVERSYKHGNKRSGSIKVGELARWATIIFKKKCVFEINNFQ
jgi:hypothetical protein